MEQKDRATLNEKLTSSEQSKKRLEEIKQSNILMNSQISANNFYVPKRKSKKKDDCEIEFIKPRKKRTLPFSDEQKSKIESTMQELETQYKNDLKEKKHEEKFLLKEEVKVAKLIVKTNKKIDLLISKSNTEELEKTMDIQKEYLKVFDKIQDDLNTLVLSENNVSLEDRRKHIYNRAYNAETERARKMIESRNKKQAHWQNQLKKDKNIISKRTSDDWRERLGISEEKD